MLLKEEYKILRDELSKNPEIKILPEFIISGLEKLGYRTDDLQTPQPNGSITFRGNEWLVFAVGENYNRLEESYLQVATILKQDAELSKTAHDWLYGLEHISEIDIITRRAFQEVGINKDFKELKSDYKNDKSLFSSLSPINKVAVKYILENPNDSYRIPMKMTFDVNNSIYTGNMVRDLEKDNKIKNKVKP
ncbi:hypothetical protein AO073_01400 [Pseudomonas syringae ICMP 11293]|uniref:hypothetical protein n=1 Tax=Pseudomonas syringae TaxID=317 RepID=UPI00072FD579|nr:hypothetical protein [Pseudomonas syringae]KTB91556.1 hypothetical protein AO073_01400 [Pseudomonas syringae ICMP 11293]